MLIVNKIGHRSIKTNDITTSVTYSPVITSMNSERNTNMFWLSYVHPCNVTLLLKILHNYEVFYENLQIISAHKKETYVEFCINKIQF